MVTKFYLMVLCVLISTNVFADSPVGTWEVTGKGRSPQNKGEKFLGYVTFNENGTVSGYFISFYLFTTVNLEGTWSLNELGRTFINYTTTSDQENDSGTGLVTVKRGNLKGTITEPTDGTFAIVGLIAIANATPIGSYSGFTKSGNFRNGLSLTFTATSKSNLYNLSGETQDGFSVTGQLMVGRKTIIFWGDDEDKRSSITGKFNPLTGTITGKGVNEYQERGNLFLQRN